MSLDRNGKTCSHNVTLTDDETLEEYCADCGEVVEPDEEEDGSEFAF
jgi:transcription initiation factor TFIIIB Brf1 subunit/transcription initiation factor TFIIB